MEPRKLTRTHLIIRHKPTCSWVNMTPNVAYGQKQNIRRKISHLRVADKCPAKLLCSNEFLNRYWMNTILSSKAVLTEVFVLNFKISDDPSSRVCVSARVCLSVGIRVFWCF